MQDTITLSKDTFAHLLISALDLPEERHKAHYNRLLNAEFDLFWFLHHVPHVPAQGGGAALPRTTLMAQAVIAGAVEKAQLVEALTAPEQAERGLSVIGEQVRDVVEGWCGTRVPGRPHPPKFGDVLTPVELLITGAHFQQAASASHHALSAILTEAADRLFTTGLKRLEDAA